MRRDDRFYKTIASTFEIDVLLFLRARLVIKEILTSRRNSILLLGLILIIKRFDLIKEIDIDLNDKAIITGVEYTFL